MEPLNNVTSSAAQTCYVEPQQEQTGQAEFEQRLTETEPTRSTSDLLETESPSTVTSGTTIQARERCPASSFVSGRALLSATLAGANLGALRNEISQAQQRTTQWSRPTGSFVNTVDSDRIFNEAQASSYLTLHRFQSEASHCKPRVLFTLTAMDHVRSRARLRSDPSLERLSARYELRQASTAVEHMMGDTYSPFVSLAEDASRVRVSPDHGARMIAENANELHTYTVPRIFVWTPEKIANHHERASEIVSRYEPTSNFAEPSPRTWASRTPTQETEVLFLGCNLDDYRTASETNPYRTSE
ncbi:hypothetical protein AAFG07_32125 [Bradyrhizobium sp. B097]|uniref:hypothetical protein n=1 Tax=Bradyrhizobium sp. B097 TaxID=3140244 RepID=UPI003183A4A8